MDKIYKEFKEAKKKAWYVLIGLPLLFIFAYYSFILSSYIALGVSILGIIFVTWNLYSRFKFNSYLNSQRLLVEKNPELVMKNLSELFEEMKLQDQKFEEEAFAIGDRQANELIEIRKKKKRTQRKEVYDIVFAIKDYIRKQNNIK